jgi:hypothetical protein
MTGLINGVTTEVAREYLATLTATIDQQTALKSPLPEKNTLPVWW